MSKVIADIHCHPSMKFHADRFFEPVPSKQNTIHHLPRKGWRKLLGRVFGFTRFTQTDPKSLNKGGVNIVFSAIYPMEKEFSRAKVNGRKNRLIEYLFHLPTGLGQRNIRNIRDTQKGYFSEAEQEYRFLESMHGRKYVHDGNVTAIKLIRDINEIDIDSSGKKFTINIFPTIEGAHALYSKFTDIGEDTLSVRADVFRNIEKVKSWEYAPVFITVAHHFWNGFCGHAESIPGFFKRFRLVNQQEHLDEGVSEFGKEVIHKLLDKSDKRILIDIKHMSYQARQDYFRILDNEYTFEQIPIVASHAAIRGDHRNAHLFYNKSINFSNDELVRIAKSGGLFGIQLDKNRIASSKEVRKFRMCLTKRQVLQHTALLIWRQVEHIADVLDAAGENAWDMQCIGSDYDGIVNPLNGVWTAAEYRFLEEYLLVEAKSYINSGAFINLKNSFNRQITAVEIVRKFMGDNVLNFIHRCNATKRDTLKKSIMLYPNNNHNNSNIAGAYLCSNNIIRV